jgi:PKHD-type hydroxylase
MIDILERDIGQYDSHAQESQISGNQIDKVIRNSKNVWISTDHWIGGWLWYYISRINRQNFQYDLIDIDGGNIQYTHYGEGQYYTWHKDGDIETQHTELQEPSSGGSRTDDQVIWSGETVRKLSFSLQLSDPNDYTGGEVQFMGHDGKTYFAPKQRGTLIVFDSRISHRVRKVRSGMRKSLVGWVVGPRWK